MLEQFQRIEGAAAEPRRRSGVRCLAEELYFRGGQRQPGPVGDLVLVVGVPGQDDIGVLESAGHDHEGLADQDLLGGRSEDLDGAGQLLRDARLVRGDSGGDSGGSEQVVPAAVPRRIGRARILFRLAGLLREAGERVVLGEDADDGRAGTGGGHECRRHPADVARDFEVLLLEQVRHHSRGLRLLQGGLGELPDLSRDLLPARAGLIEIGIGRRRTGGHQKGGNRGGHTC